MTLTGRGRGPQLVSQSVQAVGLGFLVNKVASKERNRPAVRHATRNLTFGIVKTACCSGAAAVPVSPCHPPLYRTSAVTTALWSLGTPPLKLSLPPCETLDGTPGVFQGLFCSLCGPPSSSALGKYHGHHNPNTWVT